MNIQQRQRTFTDRMLFENYLVSSAREEQVFSPFPYCLDRKIFERMTYAAGVLDRLVRRIITKAIENPEIKELQLGDFPRQKDILGLTAELLPFFWARYDAFQREDGGIFFSEFNYDKPCAQRETVVSEKLLQGSNPSTGFSVRFAEGFRKLCGSAVIHGDRLNAAILVDPGHYEEVHLAQLYMDLLEPLGYDIIIVGGDNLNVQDDRVLAFGRVIDVILRQFPTEYLHELPEIDGILRLHNEGGVLMINDPRAILGQAKSLFAFLWDKVGTGSAFLTDEEISIIKETIPYTEIYNPDKMVPVRENKNKFVIKAVYGRYSEDVYIGCMSTEEEWQEILEYVNTSGELYIIQEFCPIKKDRVFRFAGSVFEDSDAFGNFGIYLIHGEYAGICVRWSTDYLSCDDVVWSSPVGIREKSLQARMPIEAGRSEKWLEINDEAAFTWGYTDNYTNTCESFLLQSLFLDETMRTELQEATEKAVIVLKKAAQLVQEHPEMLCPVLGIGEKLGGLVTQDLTHCIAFIGRFDWVYDIEGNLKLLEFNAETPGGLLESMVIGKLVKEKLKVEGTDPNEKLGLLIEEAFLNIVNDYAGSREIRNIGLVSSAYHEDWYNTTILYRLLKHLPYDFFLGDVAGLEGGDGKLKLYGVELDAVYRYYPLDWFDKDSFFEGVIDSLTQHTLSINPPATLIYQSKAFFALVWELVENGFYSRTEAEFIRSHIPKTTLAPKKPDTWDYCIKPLFGREGDGISYSIHMDERKLEGTEYALQKRIDIQPVELNICSTMQESREIMYPVIGTYVAGDRFAGIFTRAGGRITDKMSVYLPTYLK